MTKLFVEIERSKGWKDEYIIDYKANMTVLDVLEEIYRQHDPTITYRFSCKTGLCATCITMINDKPALSCMEVIQIEKNNKLSLAPLPKGETIKDLVKKSPM